MILSFEEGRLKRNVGVQRPILAKMPVCKSWIALLNPFKTKKCLYWCLISASWIIYGGDWFTKSIIKLVSYMVKFILSDTTEILNHKRIVSLISASPETFAIKSLWVTITFIQNCISLCLYFIFIIIWPQYNSPSTHC